MRKTQRQPSCIPAAWMSRPPASGPTAVEMPTAVARSPNARLRARPLNRRWMVALIAG
jgi:hypothetical protein